MEVYEQQTSWPLVLKNSKTIVLWGSDLIKNQQANWWCPDHDVYEYYEQLKEKAANGEIKVMVSTQSPLLMITLGVLMFSILRLTRKRMSHCN